jgi:excisionase family DNA binding protein
VTIRATLDELAAQLPPALRRAIAAAEQDTLRRILIDEPRRRANGLLPASPALIDFLQAVVAAMDARRASDTGSESGQSATPWVTVSNVTPSCSVSDRTVRQWAADGLVRSVRVGRTYLVHRSDVLAMANDRKA